MTDERAPLLRVVRGTPTDEELAALVTVLAARAKCGGGGSPAAVAEVAVGQPWAQRAAAAVRRSGCLAGVRPAPLVVASSDDDLSDESRHP